MFGLPINVVDVVVVGAVVVGTALVVGELVGGAAVVLELVVAGGADDVVVPPSHTNAPPGELWHASQQLVDAPTHAVPPFGG